MAIASKAATIGVILVSLAVGVLFFYFFSHLPKNEKKKYTDELISQLINFIIFVWVGKILLNLSVFIQDPLAILAYPGDSNAFYLAVLFTAAIVIYKSLRKNLNLFVFTQSFVYVFLISLFFYEFLQMMLENDIYSLGYLFLSAILLIIYFLVYEKVKPFILLMMILTGWTVGVLILNYIYPFVAVFGYLLNWGFIVTFYICSAAILILFERKGRA